MHASTHVCKRVYEQRRGWLCTGNMLANILAGTQGRRCWRWRGQHRSCTVGACVSQPCTARGPFAPSSGSHQHLLLGPGACTQSGCTCAGQTWEMLPFLFPSRLESTTLLPTLEVGSYKPSYGAGRGLLRSGGGGKDCAGSGEGGGSVSLEGD